MVTLGPGSEGQGRVLPRCGNTWTEGRAHVKAVRQVLAQWLRGREEIQIEGCNCI